MKTAVKNTNKIIKMLKEKLQVKECQIFYTSESFNLNTPEVIETTVDGGTKIYYRVYQSEAAGELIVRWTDQPNAFFGFKSVVLLVND